MNEYWELISHQRAAVHRSAPARRLPGAPKQLLDTGDRRAARAGRACGCPDAPVALARRPARVVSASLARFRAPGRERAARLKHAAARHKPVAGLAIRMKGGER